MVAHITDHHSDQLEAGEKSPKALVDDDASCNDETGSFSNYAMVIEFDAVPEKNVVQLYKSKRKKPPSFAVDLDPLTLFRCHPCEIDFATETALTNHINNVHKTNNRDLYNCTKCKRNSVFQSLDDLKEHEKRLHPPPPQTCSHCKETLSTERELWLHLKKNHQGYRNICLECGKKLASSGSLHNHKKSVHEAVKKFSCSQCDRRFALKQKLDNHVLRDHEGKYPFQCNECDKGFVHKQSLDAHLRSHRGEPLKCEQCGKPYMDISNLRKHLKWHAMVQEARSKSKSK